MPKRTPGEYKTWPGLDGKERARFQRLQRWLEGEGLWREADAAALARYVQLETLAARLRQTWEDEGRPTITLGGATGVATVIHPLVGAYQAAEQNAANLAARLLLDPAARIRLKHKAPQASTSQRVTGEIGVSPAQRLRAVGDS